MNITLAKNIGFCMGVKRAFKIALKTKNINKGTIYTYGPLIHNATVLHLLEKKGIYSIDKIPTCITNNYSSSIIIRAHGVPINEKQNLLKSKFSIIDATCPRIATIQNIIYQYSIKNFKIILFGEAFHPEVVALKSYVSSKIYIIDDEKSIQVLPNFKKAILIAQTTQDYNKYNSIKKYVQISNPHYKIFDTICNSARIRQIETKNLSTMNDVVIVVGDKRSGNTKRLIKLIINYNGIVISIENENELFPEKLPKNIKSIAITTGTSTPYWVIKKVHNILTQYYN